MTVELISVGTELLLGNTINTNAAYLSGECAKLGLYLYYQITVGDNEERLYQTIKEALGQSDIIILTGGLGPTEDDITKETTAKVLSRPLICDEESKANILEYFKAVKKEPAENNWKQADIIDGSIVLKNNNGTAPGMIIKTEEGKHLILLPGPPNEMKPMFEELVYPYLSNLQPQIFYSNMVKLCGIGESSAEMAIRDLIDSQTNPTIAPYAKTGEVHFRITARAKTKEEGRKLVKPLVKELKERFGKNIYTTEETENLEDVVVRQLRKLGLTLTTAESCTGGLLAGRIINVSGASEVLNQGFITYSNKSKKKYLDVNKSTLKKYGAVSSQTAKEMAKGAALGTDSDTSISVTGFAGPDGGTQESPIGTVFIGCYVNESVTVKEFHFKGNRQKIRELAVINALDLLRRCLAQHYK